PGHSVFRTDFQQVPANGRQVFTLPYELKNLQVTAFKEFLSEVELVDEKGDEFPSSSTRFATWTTPIKLDLGALYLRRDQKQFVRMNFGFSSETKANLKTVRLVVMRGPHVLRTVNIDATPKALLAQRGKIPLDLRDDFARLLLADLDVGFLP